MNNVHQHTGGNRYPNTLAYMDNIDHFISMIPSEQKGL